MTKIEAMTAMNLVTLKVSAERKLLFNKLASEVESNVRMLGN